MNRQILLLLTRLMNLIAVACSAAEALPGRQISTGNPDDDQQAPLIVRVAFPSIMDIDDVAILLAMEKVQDQGLAFVPTFYAQSELAVAATAAGDAAVFFGGTANWLSAVKKVPPLRA